MSGIADTYQFNLPQHGRPQDVTIVKTWYPDIKRYWPNCTSVREVHPIDGIRAVVFHATAGYSSDDAVSVMRKSQKQASFGVGLRAGMPGSVAREERDEPSRRQWREATRKSLVARHRGRQLATEAFRRSVFRVAGSGHGPVDAILLGEISEPGSCCVTCQAGHPQPE
jgi:hypothetical protein